MTKVKVDLTGKVALITGGGSGIGRGFALRLAADGAAAIVTDLNGNAAAEVAAEIATLGGRSFSRPVDVTDPAALPPVIAETLTRFGQLDFLFANAGALGPPDLLMTTPQDWDLVLGVNVKGVALACQAVMPHMMARRQGRIVITASYNGIRSGAHVIPYRVSKAAVLMYTRCLALVMAPYNVTVNAICPGVTLTPMQLDYAAKTAAEQGMTKEAYLTDRADRIPMGQFTEIEDLNDLAAFLVSDSARLITGQAVGPDGGMMASS
jgi:NAD(P)-dependent dehydrogenase (short-subunit alcohol dehydrogenase family)